MLIDPIPPRKFTSERSATTAVTKRELEDLNEELQMEIRRLRTENARLTTALGSSTEQLRLLTERTEKLETRYTLLKSLLTDYPEPDHGREARDRSDDLEDRGRPV